MERPARQIGSKRIPATKTHKGITTVANYVFCLCLFVANVPPQPRPRGCGLDVYRACFGRVLVPDQREVRYCTPAGGTRLPTPTPQGSVNARACVVREKRVG